MQLGKIVAAAAALAFTAYTGTAHAGPTLDAIKERGAVRCGVNTGLAGFSIADGQGLAYLRGSKLCVRPRRSRVSAHNKHSSRTLLQEVHLISGSAQALRPNHPLSTN